MVAYTIVHVSSEQGKNVFWPHIIELPVKIYINFKIGVYCIAKSWGAKRYPRPPPPLYGWGAAAPAAPQFLRLCSQVISKFKDVKYHFMQMTPSCSSPYLRKLCQLISPAKGLLGWYPYLDALESVISEIK